MAILSGSEFQSFIVEYGGMNICNSLCWCGWYWMLCYWDVERDAKLAEDFRWPLMALWNILSRLFVRLIFSGSMFNCPIISDMYTSPFYCVIIIMTKACCTSLDHFCFIDSWGQLWQHCDRWCTYMDVARSSTLFACGGGFFNWCSDSCRLMLVRRSLIEPLSSYQGHTLVTTSHFS